LVGSHLAVPGKRLIRRMLGTVPHDVLIRKMLAERRDRTVPAPGINRHPFDPEVRAGAFPPDVKIVGAELC